ncbi:MAG: T9SS type A sorting domain-containing protein, partial [Bacteroidales bacterium]
PTEAWQSWVELPPSGVGAGFRWKSYSVQLPAEAISGSTQVALLYDDGRSLGYGAALDNVQVVELLSGIDQATNRPTVELFPNPSAGMSYIRLQADTPLTIRLIDHAGRSLQTKHIENPNNLTEPLDLMNYPDGTYFVLIETDNEVIVRQLIKTR